MCKKFMEIIKNLEKYYSVNIINSENEGAISLNPETNIRVSDDFYDITFTKMNDTKDKFYFITGRHMNYNIFKKDYYENFFHQTNIDKVKITFEDKIDKFGINAESIDYFISLDPNDNCNSFAINFEDHRYEIYNEIFLSDNHWLIAIERIKEEESIEFSKITEVITFIKNTLDLFNINVINSNECPEYNKIFDLIENKEKQISINKEIIDSYNSGNTSTELDEKLIKTLNKDIRKINKLLNKNIFDCLFLETNNPL